VVEIASAGTEKVSKEMVAIGEGLPSTAEFKALAKTSSRVARVGGVVSAVVDFNDLTTGETPADVGHGGMGLVVTAVSMLQPEIGVGWAIIDLTVQQASYDDYHTHVHSEGWTALKDYSSDAADYLQNLGN
jgi:hypothetical protein